MSSSTLALTPPARPATGAATALAVAGRTVRTFQRTPQLVVVGAISSAMFLLLFRYVFGGAIETGAIRYVDFFVPAFVVMNSALFAGSAAASGVAEDVEGGLFDRLRSLPVPRRAILVGRSLADTALAGWSISVCVIVGLAVGFRLHGSLAGAAAAIGLSLLFAFAFTWLFILIGLASGNAQAAQGMAMVVFPLSFVSSGNVPVESMPGWMQPIAEHQPLSMMVGAVRALTIGGDVESVLGHSTGWFVLRAVLWSLAIAAVFGGLAVRRFNRA